MEEGGGGAQSGTRGVLGVSLGQYQPLTNGLSQWGGSGTYLEGIAPDFRDQPRGRSDLADDSPQLRVIVRQLQQRLGNVQTLECHDGGRRILLQQSGRRMDTNKYARPRACGLPGRTGVGSSEQTAALRPPQIPLQNGQTALEATAGFA